MGLPHVSCLGHDRMSGVSSDRRVATQGSHDRCHEKGGVDLVEVLLHSRITARRAWKESDHTRFGADLRSDLHIGHFQHRPPVEGVVPRAKHAVIRGSHLEGKVFRESYEGSRMKLGRVQVCPNPTLIIKCPSDSVFQSPTHPSLEALWSCHMVMMSETCDGIDLMIFPEKSR